ncbi:MAG TPA: membrane protein insertase YidC [Sporichthya sp.]|nr:membrane protein insertase YidC [Sporichthya sp.]
MKILDPLYDAVSWIILTFHRGFDDLGMSPSWSWCLAIVCLVVLIRILLIPLFVKQIKSMRAMQQLQPEIKKIQQRYKGDRERTSQELMKLYKEHNTNPLASCFPILAQAPIFLALYKVLNKVSKEQAVGVMDLDDVRSAGHASFFGAHLDEKFLGATSFSVHFVTILMILGMSASQFWTQRQLMTKNMPATAMESSPFLRQQKVMMYLFPIMFAVFGINFPVGVLLYWLVSNLWSMGQQMYVIRRMPAVGSKAHDAMLERRARKGGGTAAGSPTSTDTGSDGTSGPPGGARKRGPQPGAKPGGGAAGGAANGTASGAAPARQQPQRQPKSKRAGSKKR